MFKFCLGQHCALALLCAAAAEVFGFECIRHGLVTHQAVVERQLFAAPHLAAGFDEHTPLHVDRLAIGLTRVIDPARIVAAVQAIDHPRVIDVEVKRVLGVARIMRVAA